MHLRPDSAKQDGTHPSSDRRSSSDSVRSDTTLSPFTPHSERGDRPLDVPVDSPLIAMQDILDAEEEEKSPRDSERTRSLTPKPQTKRGDQRIQVTGDRQANGNLTGTKKDHKESLNADTGCQEGYSDLGGFPTGPPGIRGMIWT